MHTNKSYFPPVEIGILVWVLNGSQENTGYMSLEKHAGLPAWNGFIPSSIIIAYRAGGT